MKHYITFRGNQYKLCNLSVMFALTSKIQETRISFSHRQIDGIAPTFSKKPAIRQEEDGKRLLFECRIQADPRPTVAWSHNGVAVQNSSRHKVR